MNEGLRPRLAAAERVRRGRPGTGLPLKVPAGELMYRKGQRCDQEECSVPTISKLGTDVVMNGPATAKPRRSRQRGCHLERGPMPDRLTGHDQAGDDAQVDRGLALRERAELFHPPAEEREAVETQGNPAGRQGREGAAARQGHGHHQQHFQVDQPDAGRPHWARVNRTTGRRWP